MQVKKMAEKIFSFNFSVAKTTALVKTNSKGIFTWVKSKYKKFFSNKKKDFELEIMLKKTGENKKGKIVLKKKPLFEVELKENQLIFKEKNKSIQCIKGFFDLNSKKGRIKIFAQKEFFWICFVDVLIACYAFFFLFFHRGAMFHSCAVKEKGKAYLFAGKSSEGKTTIARLSGKEKVLNDEINLVIREKGRTMVYGFPLKGEFVAGKKGVPLKKVFLIKKSSRIKVLKMPKMKSLFQLSAHAFPLFFAKKKGKIFFETIIVIDELLKNKECNTLLFTRNNPFWRKI